MLQRLFDSPIQLLIILVLVVLLFGAKRLPDAARGLGRSMRILKSEVRDMKEEEQQSKTATALEAGTRTTDADDLAQARAAEASVDRRPEL